MRSINGVIALAGVLVVVGYLIARPHIGTVWHEREITGSLVHPGPSTVKVLRFNSYPSFDTCDREARADTASQTAVEELPSSGPPTSTTAYNCVAENVLLWGW